MRADVSRWSWIVAKVTLVLLMTWPPSPALASHDPPEYSDRQIQDLIDYAFEVLPSLQPRDVEPVITGDDSLDDRIWEVAFARGYRLQPSAVDEDLVVRDGMLMQAPVAEAWERLQAGAEAAGHEIAITSAFRGLVEQRDLFISGLAGTSDAAIDDRLSIAAPPGASRHHTGYALDLREVGDTLGDFEATESFEWLTADNYHNALVYGFVPSYPSTVFDAGPDPEAWEWVYVGEGVIFHDGPFWDVLPTHLFATEIEWMSTTAITHGCSSDEEWFCPDLEVDRGQMAAFLRRALELPVADMDHFVDDDGSIFEGDIDAIALAGVTKGCNPPENTRYCPTHKLDRGAMAAFLTRALSLPASGTDHFVDDDGSIFEGDINAMAQAGITRGCNPPDNDRYCPNGSLSRGEMAAMLYRARSLLP